VLRHDPVGRSPIGAWFLQDTLTVPDFVFFYGTLMSGFDRRRRLGVDDKLTYIGRGYVRASLFDLGIYPAAVPAPEGAVWGEIYETHEPDVVLEAIDGIQGYRPDSPEQSLYTRTQAPVTLADGHLESCWVYFYNAPMGGAQRIASGDYLEHVRAR